jgi:cytochrome c oxidase assembly protein subunit 16
MGLGKNRRKVDLNEEYYVSSQIRVWWLWKLTWRQKLATKDIDNWEQKRVERLKGEHDGRL